MINLPIHKKIIFQVDKLILSSVQASLWFRIYFRKDFPVRNKLPKRRKVTENVDQRFTKFSHRKINSL